jgi:hypothetical protein
MQHRASAVVRDPGRPQVVRVGRRSLLVEHLRALDLSWPTAEFDVEKEKERVGELTAAATDGWRTGAGS